MTTANNAAPVIPQTQNVPDPSLSDVLRLNNNNLMTNFNCHHIATVQSFNSTNQTVSATLNYQKTFFEFNTETGLYDAVFVPYPILTQCPAVVLGGGGGAITFPINAGDECLLLFNDRNLDNWFTTGQKAASTGVSTPRLHSFADAIALVGLRSLPNVISNYSTTHAELRANTGVVGINVSNGKILISNGSSLGSALQSFCTSCEASTDGTLVDAATALSSALGEILE